MRLTLELSDEFLGRVKQAVYIKHACGNFIPADDEIDGLAYAVLKEAGLIKSMLPEGESTPAPRPEPR